MKQLIFIVVCLSVLLSGCGKGPEFHSIEDYLHWLSDPDNGLVKTRSVNGIELKVTYLPAEYMAYTELKEQEQISRLALDSLISYYKSGLYFLLKIGPDEEAGAQGDIMFNGLQSYAEYAERARAMNFDLDQHVWLKSGTQELHPVLSTLENTYGLQEYRNILFAFTPEAGEETISERMEFIYEDELFGLGTNYFVFNKSTLEKIPTLKF